MKLIVMILIAKELSSSSQNDLWGGVHAWITLTKRTHNSEIFAHLLVSHIIMQNHRIISYVNTWHSQSTNSITFKPLTNCEDMTNKRETVLYHRYGVSALEITTGLTN